MKRNSKKASLQKEKVTPLRLVENAPCTDTLSTLEYLTELARKGECRGIAFGAFIGGDKIAHGYTGVAMDRSFTTVGILSQVISDIQSNS
jgi:hypothetical protein